MRTDEFAAMISGLEACGISRPEIARRARISCNTVWRLASGEAKQPKYETIQKVMDLKQKVERNVHQ